MKARLPQGYGGGGAANIQQLARQAQKIQENCFVCSVYLHDLCPCHWNSRLFSFTS